jgi:xylulokinase
VKENRLVIGLDSSTTACKAVVWDARGKAVAEARAAQPMLRPRPAWHEQPADSWWSAAADALRAAVRQVDPARLAGLSISTQRETFTGADACGSPLGNALLWMDERAREVMPGLRAQAGAQAVHAATGKPLSANLTLSKLFWLRAFQPDLLDRFERVLDVHAFLALRLTGRCATSWACADPTGLFNIHKNAWDADLVGMTGLQVEQFPEALPVGALVGEVTAEAARATGLPEGLPVFAGAGDGQAAGFGLGVCKPGAAYLALGTSIITGAYSDTCLVDPAFRTMYGALPGSYALEAVLLGGAYTVSWFFEKFAAQEALAAPALSAAAPPLTAQKIEAIESAAAHLPPGAQGLTLVPYWNSVMNPYWDASASGIVVGWRGVHGPEHLYRAILEGTALELRLHIEGIEAALGRPVERLRAAGGGSQSPLWRRIIADVTGRPVERADTTEASALGAGMLAALGAGLFPDPLAAVAAMARPAVQVVQPNPGAQAFYTRLYEDVYRTLYPSVRTALARLADLTDAAESI